MANPNHMTDSVQGMDYTIALFGPLSTHWTEDNLLSLHSALQHSGQLEFLKQTIVDLPSLWPVLEQEFGEQTRRNLSLLEAIKALSTIATSSPAEITLDPNTLTNTQLAPLTVVSQIIDFISVRGSNIFDNLESSQGFCIGFLGAAALSAARTWAEFQTNVCNAIRLATCVGFVIDAHETSKDAQDRAVTLSGRWKSAAQRAYLETCVDSEEATYISCLTDDNTLTITLPLRSEASLRKRLSEAKMTVSAVGLHGAYHHPTLHSQAAKKLAKLCAQNADVLSLPNADMLRLPLRSTGDAQLIAKGPLHEAAIDLILCKKAHWFQTVKMSVSHFDTNSAASVSALVLGKNKGSSVIPASLRRGALSSADGTQPLQATTAEDHTNSQKSVQEEVAVVGMACRFPRAENLSAFWDLLSKGETAFGPFPKHRFRPDEVSREPKLANGVLGNFLDRADIFDHAFFSLSGREAKSMDPQQRLALEVAYEALEAAGYFNHPPDSSANNEKDVGCYLGVGAVDYEHNIASEAATAFSAVGTLRAFISGRISHFFGWKGPSITLDTACSSSAVAIHTACRALLGGECSMALAGGVNVITSPSLHQNLAAASFLNSKGEASRAFDAGASGYCRGEGAGMIVLKKLSRALADGDQILGVIAASAVNQGSNCTSITVPDSGSQSDLYRKVLERSGTRPSQVSYVEAHGTGTPVGDPIEYESVRLALAGGLKRQDKLFLGAVKDSVGHTEAASGAAGVIKVLLMMQHKAIPKQANFVLLNPRIKACPDIVIPTETQPWVPRQRVALVNNYGAAGSNAALVLRSYDPPRTEIKSASTIVSKQISYPFLLAAKTPSHLRAYAQELERCLVKSKVPGSVDLGSIAYNLSRTRNISFDHRVAFVASDVQGAISALKDLELSLADKAAATKKPPGPPAVVLCFGGQSGRSVRVSWELYDTCSAFHQHLNRCNAVVERVLGLPSIFPDIFQDEPKDDLVSLHCMLLAVQMSSAKCWIECGIVADVKNLTLVGHSFGQLSALCVAGSISLEDCFRFVAGRARLFQDSWGSDKGAMLSIECDKEELDGLVHTAKDGVDVACYNGPRSFVFAGSTSAIKQVAEDCKVRGIKSIVLNNTHAYHSRLADGILADLESLAKSITISPPKIRVETCSADDKSWSSFIAQELVKHTREPVYFSDAIQRIANRSHQSSGGTIWLEAGSATPIIPMAKRIVQSNHGGSHHDVFIPVDLSKDDGQAVSSIAQAASQLWRAGSAARFWHFHPAFGGNSTYSAVSLPPYQFDKTSHWIQLKMGSSSSNKPKNVAEGEDKKTGLVTLVSQSGAKPGEALFIIDTAHPLFVLAGRGHAVTGQSLCPASMYMELAALAAQSVAKADMSKVVPHIDGLEMSSPLGLGGLDMSVFLSLSQINPGSSWNFTLFSRSAGADNASPKTEHTRGRITWGLPDATAGGERRLRLLQRFGEQGIRRLASSTGTTGVSGSLVYALFSEVVSYADYFRGVRSVSALQNEAVGSVTVPAQLGRSSNIPATCCDPIILDNFLQVAGIHVNCLSSSRQDKNQVFVCTAVEEVMFTPSFMASRADNSQEWTVYTRCDISESASPLEISNDIFVCDAKSRRLVLAVLGATFRGVPFKSLARGLTRLNNIKIPLPETKQATASIPAIKTPDSDVPGDSGYQTGSSVAGQDQESSKASPVKNQTDNVQLVRSFFSGILEVSVDEITPTSTLDELGVDSLLIMEVISEIQSQFHVSVSQDDLLGCKDVSAVSSLIWPDLKLENPSQHQPAVWRDETHAIPAAKNTNSTYHTMADTNNKRDQPKIATLAQECFAKVKPSYSNHATTTNFVGFYRDAFSLQSDLVVRYVVDAFATLGCDLNSMPPDHQVPMIPFDPKHTKLIPQLYKILLDGGLIAKEMTTSTAFRRTKTPIPVPLAETLHQRMLTNFPVHASETKLLHTTGPKLADYLTGKIDPIGLIFQNAAARALLEDVYTNAPMFKTGTLLLGEYLASLLSRVGGHDTDRELRILELGAGTGGTSKHLIEKLSASGHKFSYTFTDLSSSLVVAAKRKFSKYSSVMHYRTLDIEQDPPEELLGKYDVILSTNCIHATRNLVVSTGNIKRMLSSDGVLCLVELTRNLYWFDLVFGLLEGWWLFNDGREHALAHEQTWDRSLKQAGFNWVDWSADNSLPESDILRVITASPFKLSIPEPPPLVRKQTLVFKEIDGLKLEADIYYPPTTISSTKKLPIAMMIHGGGHIMLSKNDIRPEQTDMLLSNGFLPISIDYQLCPETTLLDGPMSDVADALAWTRNVLPTLTSLRPDVVSVGIDADKIVAIGWSSGGHLAMTLAWTCPVPPSAILAFYCATDYEDTFWTEPNVPVGAAASEIDVQDQSYDLDSDHEFWSRGLMERPITAYNVPAGKRALGGWLAPSDPRSRLALHMNTHGRTLHVLLRGLSKNKRGPLVGGDGGDVLDVEVIKKASPLAQVRRGMYHVPTFLIHPRLDDLIPWQQSERTWKALRERGVDAELRVVGGGAPHLFDMMHAGGGGGRKVYEEGMKAVEEGYGFLARHVGREWRSKSS